MRAFVYVGGNVNPDRVTEHPKGDDLLIAADSGWNNAKALGVTPQILVGDFDSLGNEKLKEIPKGVEIFQLPCEKNETDTQMAVNMAIARGADDLVIVGGLSGRLDHTLSNLGVLRYLFRRNLHGVLTDGDNRVRYLCNGGTLLGKSAYTYLSLLADGEKVKGVSVEGVKYPLKNAVLTKEHQYAVSNEMTGNCALIEVRKGGIFIVESV